MDLRNSFVSTIGGMAVSEGTRRGNPYTYLSIKLVAELGQRITAVIGLEYAVRKCVGELGLEAGKEVLHECIRREASNNYLSYSLGLVGVAFYPLGKWVSAKLGQQKTVLLEDAFLYFSGLSISLISASMLKSLETSLSNSQ